MSYQREREDFIARMTREGLPIDVTRLLLREATGLNRRAELACSSEAADRDRVPCPASRDSRRPCLCDPVAADQGVPNSVIQHRDVPRIAVQDWHAEARIMRALTKINDRILQNGQPIDVQNPALWAFLTQGDPRGAVLGVIPPSYAERNAGRDQFNVDTIGVPSGPSGLRW